jgi:hypothetical protein
VATTPLITFAAKFGDWVRMADTTSEMTRGAVLGSVRVITKAEITFATCCVRAASPLSKVNAASAKASELLTSTPTIA